MKTLKYRPKNRPLFMGFTFTDPHCPYRHNTILDPHTNADVVVPTFLPDVPDTRKAPSYYYEKRFCKSKSGKYLGCCRVR